MDSKHKKTESTNLLKNSLLTIAGLAVLGVGLWALMYYSTPASNLQPYTRYQEEKNNPIIKNNSTKKSAPDVIQKTASSSETALGNLVKTATSNPPPRNTLPRQALEHIQKGMQLTEKGEFNAGSMEFEKASIISPNSAELYSIWGAAMRMAKKFEGANKRFARAHELSPNDSEITFNWAMSQLEGDIPEDAIWTATTSWLTTCWANLMGVKKCTKRKSPPIKKCSRLIRNLHWVISISASLWESKNNTNRPHHIS
jgi:tetratricopeptide (TPR) repeat protein